MRERVILFEVLARQNIDETRLSKIGERFASDKDVGLCHRPRARHAVEFQIRTDLTDTQVAASFSELSNKRVRILEVQEKNDA